MFPRWCTVGMKIYMFFHTKNLQNACMQCAKYQQHKMQKMISTKICGMQQNLASSLLTLVS